MRSPLTAWVLMLCLCWQSLAYAGAEVVVTDGDELVHAMMHFEGEAHHHDDHGGHDGGVFHQDDSSASANHLVNDACVYAPALLAQATLPLLAVCAAPPAEPLAGEPPPPVLDGPERPPKTPA